MTSFLHASARLAASYLSIEKGETAMLMRTTSPCTGSRNRFLAGLSRDDAALLDGLTEPVSLSAGMMLATSGTPLEMIYFPETVVVSIGNRHVNGYHVEAAVIGYEGMVGWSAFGGPVTAHHDAIVQMAGGTAVRISRQNLTCACARSTTLMSAATQIADVLAVQMTQAVLSVVCDTIERRLCRWLLMRHDRLLTDQLVVRHDEIGGNLGIRRASVTDALHILEGERLIRCHRGRIIVRDRVGLERLAAGSYGTSEAYYREHIAPFGRVVPPQPDSVSKSLLTPNFCVSSPSSASLASLS